MGEIGQRLGLWLSRQTISGSALHSHNYPSRDQWVLTGDQTGRMVFPNSSRPLKASQPVRSSLPSSISELGLARYSQRAQIQVCDHDTPSPMILPLTRDVVER
jgi:hypothetical protein